MHESNLGQVCLTQYRIVFRLLHGQHCHLMGHPLRICTFNVLAPSARICKPLDSIPWRDRHDAICDTVSKLRPDIVCLQEFDFAPRTSGFAELYETKLGSMFEMHLKKRTGNKQEGLALLCHRESVESVEV